MELLCGASLIAMPAQGERWPTGYSLKAGGLRQLPKRLMREMIHLEVWDSVLLIDKYRYDGVTAFNAAESTGKA